MTALLDRRFGSLDRFPLTPTLSRREREHMVAVSRFAGRTFCNGLASFPPLPAGEGRGEGELHAAD